MINFDLTGILNQAVMFFKIFFFGLLFLVPTLAIFYFKTYNYIVERNVETGSGAIVEKFRAKKHSSDGKVTLKGFGFGKKKPEMVFPDSNAFVYKMSDMFNSKLIRFYVPDSSNYYPMKLALNSPAQLEALPQDARFMFRLLHKSIDDKYKGETTFMEKYGQLIGLGILVIGFAIIAFFMLEKIGDAISLGQSVLATARESATMQYIPAG